MKNRQLLIKVVFIVFIALLLLSLAAPVIFPQSGSPKRENLLNGLKVLMWPDSKADKVDIRLRVHSGSAFDPQGKEGVMRLLADSLFPNEAAKEFFTDDLGGSLEIVSNYDYIEVRTTAKPEHLLTVLETLSTAVSNPTIDKETSARLRDELLTKVKTLEEDPGYVADQAAAKRLLGAFPYGRPQFGTAASLAKVDFADLIDARERFLGADNATLAIAGNFDQALAFRAIRRYFGGWLKSDKRIPSTFRQPDAPPVGVLTIPSPKADESAIRIVWRGVARGDKDVAAAEVFSSVLEARLKGLVPAEFAPSVFVRNDINALPGTMVIGFSAVRNAGAIKIEAADIVTKALGALFSDAEFAAAKAAARTRWGKRDTVALWLDAETYKLAAVDPEAKAFENLTLADVRSFAEKLKKQPSATVLVNTPPAEAKPAEPK